MSEMCIRDSLTEALVALNIELAGVVVLGQGGGQRLLVVDVTLDLRAAGILLLQAEDGRLSDCLLYTSRCV